MKKVLILIGILVILLLVILLPAQKNPPMDANISSGESALVITSHPWVPLMQFEKYQKYFINGLQETGYMS